MSVDYRVLAVEDSLIQQKVLSPQKHIRTSFDGEVLVL